MQVKNAHNMSSVEIKDALSVVLNVKLPMSEAHRRRFVVSLLVANGLQFDYSEEDAEYLDDAVMYYHRCERDAIKEGRREQGLF